MFLAHQNSPQLTTPEPNDIANKVVRLSASTLAHLVAQGQVRWGGA